MQTASKSKIAMRKPTSFFLSENQELEIKRNTPIEIGDRLVSFQYWRLKLSSCRVICKYNENCTKQRLRRATYGKNRNSFLFTTRYNNKLVAVGVNDEGYCKIIGVAEGSSEDKESRSNFLRYLKERGLN